MTRDNAMRSRLFLKIYLTLLASLAAVAIASAAFGVSARVDTDVAIAFAES